MMAEMNASAPPLTLESVVSVVEGVRRWRTLAKHLVLGYDKDDDGSRNCPESTDLDALQREHGSDEDCLKAVVSKFLQGEGQYRPASWRGVIWSLYEANEIQLADQIRSYGEQLEDDSLTVDNVTKVMEKVIAEVVLAVSGRYVMMTGIETETSVDRYLNCHPDPSWIAITSALYVCDEMAAAREAKPFHHQNDPTLTVNNLVGVMEMVTPDKKRRREVWGEMLEWDGYTPDSYIDEVDTNYTTEEEKTNDLADVYINSRPDSSWEHLAEVLYDAGELAAAKEAKSFLQQNESDLC